MASASFAARNQHLATRVALTVAGFDPSSGAGITSDLKVFAAHKVYGVAAVTALTVQSTTGVRAVEVIEPAHVRAVLGCLAEDIHIDGIKIGMLGSASIVEKVAGFLSDYRAAFPGVPIVLDPVISSSSGRMLLDDRGVRLLQKLLLPLATCVTPNLDELAQLTDRSAVGRNDIPGAARDLQQRTGAAVLVTGGHLDRPDDFLLTAAGVEHELAGERVHTRSDHGTGCALSSALLCGLICGQPIGQAAAAAKKYVTQAMRAAVPLGSGRGPMHHLYACDSQ